MKKILETCVGNSVRKQSLISFKRIYSENILMKRGKIPVTLTTLWDIIKSVPCSIAECEERFSRINIIITKVRTELLISDISVTLYVCQNQQATSFHVDKNYLCAQTSFRNLVFFFFLLRPLNFEKIILGILNVGFG